MFIYHWGWINKWGNPRKSYSTLIPIEGDECPVPIRTAKWQTLRSAPDKVQAGNKCVHWKFEGAAQGQRLTKDGRPNTRTSAVLDRKGELHSIITEINDPTCICLEGQGEIQLSTSQSYPELWRSVTASGNTVTQTDRSWDNTTVQKHSSYFRRMPNGSLQCRDEVVTDIYYDSGTHTHEEYQTEWSSFWDSTYWYQVDYHYGTLPDFPNTRALVEDSWDFTSYFLPQDYEVLCRNAVDNTRVNHVNMLTTPLELINTITGKEAAKIADELMSACSASTARGYSKLASSLYLNSRYGAKLTGTDLAGLLDNEYGPQWRQKLKGKTRGMLDYSFTRHDWVFSAMSSLTFEYAFKGFNYLTKRWDNASLPTLSDVWDAIPYSFVVDWAFGIGDMLEAHERGKYVSAMDISNIWQTAYLQSSKSLVSDDGISSLDARCFIRVGQPSVATEKVGLQSTGASKNIADGTAMFIQAL